MDAFWLIGVAADFKEVAVMFITTFKRKEVKDVPENVPDRLRMIKDFMLENNKIKISELARKLRVNEKTIKRDIEKLKDSGEIKRVGSAKGGYWEIVDAGAEDDKNE